MSDWTPELHADTRAKYEEFAGVEPMSGPVFDEAAFERVPMMLDEIERLQVAVNAEKVDRVLDRYGMQDGSLLRDLIGALERREQLLRECVAFIDGPDLLDENDALAARIRAELGDER